MATRFPLISVILPVYNGAKFLPSALATIQQQDNGEIEVWVINDGSTDYPQQVATQWAEQHSHPFPIHYFHQTNQGPGAARNRGIEKAQGELISFLDVDDLWPTGTLQRQATSLMEQPEIDLVQGHAQRFRDIPSGTNPAGEVETIGAPFLHANLGSSLFRKSVFDRVGLFDETLEFYEDLDWLMRAKAQGVGKAVLPEVTLLYRRHDDSLTAGKSLREVGLFQVLKQNLDRSRS